MYTVKVRNSIMIAHSLPSSFFGPAQNMHGATYVVDVTFGAKELDSHNVVIDIGKAKEITAEVLSGLNYKNLDELPQFKNKLTTTEFMAKYARSISSTARRRILRPRRATCAPCIGAMASRCPGATCVSFRILASTGLYSACSTRARTNHRRRYRCCARATTNDCIAVSRYAARTPPVTRMSFAPAWTWRPL